MLPRKHKNFGDIMNTFGFIRCGVVSVPSKLLDSEHNAHLILYLAQQSEHDSIDILCCQELALTGATCGSLFFNNDFLENARLALLTLAESTKELNTVLCVGFPYSDSGALYSCYAVIHRGQIRAIIPLQTSVYPFANPKTQSKGTATLHTQYEVPFLTGTFQIQCGSVSATLKVTSLNNIPFADPQFSLSCQDASIVICPSATHIYAGTSLRPSLKQFSKHYAAALLFINASPNESSGEHVFLGDCGIYELGQELTSINYLKSKPFSFNTNKCIFSDVDIQYIQQYKQRHALSTSNEVSMNEPQPTLLPIDLQTHQVAKLKYPLSPTPYIPDFSEDSCQVDEETFYTNILNYSALALARRLHAIGTNKMLLGISGGVDSTFALLVCVWSQLFQGKDTHSVHAITMPCFATTERTKNNALRLAQVLNCSTETIDISDTVKSHFHDIGHNENEYNTTFENAQARERTQVLLDKANSLGGIVVSASDLSEIALGWSTFAGDHISQYNVAASLPKTVLRKFLSFFANKGEIFKSNDTHLFHSIISDILDTPVSPELIPSHQANTIGQKTEDILGSYELHDFITWHFVKNNFTKEKILFLAKIAFAETYSEQEIERCVHLFFKRFFTNQFKRSCSPEGAAVLPISLSPRSSWCMPSDIQPDFLTSFFN